MAGPDDDGRLGEKLLLRTGELDAFASELESSRSVLPHHVNADPENAEHGLAKLVLTLVELLRQLLERQAVRRIEAGSLSDEEIERLGQTFMKLGGRMEDLKRVFGLEDEELNLHLGPLGDLL
jgi:hypothetical protein